MRRAATKSAQNHASQQRRVGLDKPCTECGGPIYFNYKGPYPGLCGKCTDRRKGRPAQAAPGKT